MKQTAIVFCGADEAAGRSFAASIRCGDWITILANAYVFNRKEYQGKAYVMPDVPKWHRDRIAAAYPDSTIDVNSPPSDLAGKSVPDGVLTVKHRGRGKFYVMRGTEIVSGPHSKQSAIEIIKEKNNG